MEVFRVLAKFKGEKQLILVSTKGTNAKVYMCEQVNNVWITILETDGFIGKNGLGKLREGDLKTPAGLFNIGIAFGFEENVNTKLDYYKVDDSMYWVCNPNSVYYNRLIRISEKGKIINLSGSENNINEINDLVYDKSEHLIEESVAYRYSIEIEYNKEAIPGKGSAIFIHCTKNGPTAGCISISEENMKFILENIERTTKIYIF